jgi:hypothetical protein
VKLFVLPRFREAEERALGERRRSSFLSHGGGIRTWHTHQLQQDSRQERRVCAAALGFLTALPPEGGVPVRVPGYARFIARYSSSFLIFLRRFR